MRKFVLIGLLAALLAGCEDMPIGDGDDLLHGIGRGHGHHDDFSAPAR